MLVNEVLSVVKKKGVKELEKVSISRLDKEEEVEFFLILQFDSIESVNTFAGENYKIAYIPENTKKVLLRYDKTSRHYDFKKGMNFIN